MATFSLVSWCPGARMALPPSPPCLCWCPDALPYPDFTYAFPISTTKYPFPPATTQHARPPRHELPRLCLTTTMPFFLLLSSSRRLSPKPTVPHTLLSQLRNCHCYSCPLLNRTRQGRLGRRARSRPTVHCDNERTFEKTAAFPSYLYD